MRELKKLWHNSVFNFIMRTIFYFVILLGLVYTSEDRLQRKRLCTGMGSRSKTPWTSDPSYYGRCYSCTYHREICQTV